MQSRLIICARLIWVAAMPFCASMGVAKAGDLLFFPSVTSVARDNSADIHKKHEIEPAVDMFFSMRRESFLLLAEFFVNRDEHELERLQFGFAPTPTDKIWLGRFHTPLSYWNTAYHHGAYLQPSITRPGIAEYEDGGGILPMHATGLLIDGSRERGQTRWNYEMAAGVGPTFTDALTPFSLTERGKHGRISLSAKLGFQPVGSETDETGIFGSYTEIPFINGLYTQAKQIVAGVFIPRIGINGGLPLSSPWSTPAWKMHRWFRTAPLPIFIFTANTKSRRNGPAMGVWNPAPMHTTLICKCSRGLFPRAR